MTAEEVRLRALYLFLACSHAIETFAQHLIATFPNPTMSSRLMLDRSLRRELGILFRYWTTRQIWNALDADEASAKSLNLALLRLFTEAFHLPRDGTGLRYAELSDAAEEAREISQRVTGALGMEHAPLLAELHGGLPSWRDTVIRQTRDALGLPLPDINEAVKRWASGTAMPS